MADEQPIPSEQAPVTDAPASEPSSTEAKPDSDKAPSWWSRMFQRRPAGSVDLEEPEAEKTPEQTASEKLSLTPEELDRRIQAETDRREAARARRAEAEARRRLRDEDPWEYAAQERKAEEVAVGTQNLEQFVTSIGVEHDRASIDPIVNRLSAAERERILKMQGAGHGLEGRKMVVTEAMKALEKQWKAEGAKDAEGRLRRNSSFRKQVLAEIRGDTVEPELLPSASSSESDSTVSALLRKHYQMG